MIKNPEDLQSKHTQIEEETLKKDYNTTETIIEEDNRTTVNESPGRADSSQTDSDFSGEVPSEDYEGSPKGVSLEDSEDSPESAFQEDYEDSQENASLEDSEVSPENSSLKDYEDAPEEASLEDSESDSEWTAEEEYDFTPARNPRRNSASNRRRTSSSNSSKTSGKTSQRGSKYTQKNSGNDLARTLKQTVMVLLLIYCGGTLFFMHHFYPRTTINGINVSWRSISGVNQLLENKSENYTLTITGKDGSTDTLTTEDLGLHVEWDKQPIQDLLYQQIGFDWPEHLFDLKKLSVDVDMVVCDDTKTEKALTSLSCMDSTGKIASVNAAIIKDDEARVFEIQNDVEGTIVDPEKLLAAVKKKSSFLESTLDLEKMECYQDAEITGDSEFVHEKLEEANNALQTQIIYDFSNDQYAVLDQDTFYDWISCDSDLDLCVDEGSVIEYVDSLADEYNDYGNGKWFNTYYGNRVYIPTCLYGWEIDKTAEVEHIISEIKEGAQIERYPDYSSTANNHDYSCWGDTYIEVDITKQHMWCYKDGECVLSSDVVTGCPANDTSTDTGIFSIIGLYEDDVPLVGEDYVSYVNYFMKFYNGEGFHDASWRSSFGGSIYLTSGSHGCVNMPVDNAEALYNIVYLGYPVIIYTDDMTEGPSE